jgi:hypothetical protein
MKAEPPTGDDLRRLLVSMKSKVLEQVAHEPVVSPKRSPLTDRVIGIVLGVAVLLGLGAGAAFALGIVPPPLQAPSATTPTTTSSPTSTPTPTATQPPVQYEVAPPEPDAWTQPTSRYGLDCETLIDDAFVSDLFTTAVAPSDPIVTASGVGISIPRRTSILSVGGTVCEWSNGVATNDQYISVREYVGVTVSVVPQPIEGWSERAARFGMPSDGSHCSDFGCSATAVVGDAWVTIEALGEANALDQSRLQPLLDAVIEAVSAAGPAADPTIPERTRPPIPEDCEALIPLETVRSISSTPEVVPYMEGGGGWSEWAEAREHAGNNHGCRWSFENSFQASVDWVRDGRWAYDRMLGAGTAAPLDLTGLDRGDEASLRCDENFGSSCAVDLAVGPDWINVAANDKDAAIALAEAVLAQLSP